MNHICTLIILAIFCLSISASPHSESIHIGYTEFKPYIWSEGKIHQGIYVDILQEAFENRLGIAVIFEEYPAPRVKSYIKTGKLDAFIDISTTEKLKYSKVARVPIAVGMVGAFTYKNNTQMAELVNINTLSGLKKYNILTYNGDSWAKENLTGFNVDDGAKDLKTALKKLKIKRGDVILQIEQVAQYTIQQLNFESAIVQLPHIALDPLFYQFHLSNKSSFTPIIPKLDKTLISMLNDGSIDDIYKKHELDMPIKKGLATQKAEIKLIHYATGVMPDAFDSLAKTFNEQHNKLNLKAINMDMESYKQSIKVMLAGGRPADILMTWAGYRTQYLVNTGAIEPIDELWEKAQLHKQFSSSTARSMTYNNHKYAIPLSKHIVAIFYNKKVFQENNIDIPTTWDEFLVVAEKLKSKGIIPIALGSKERWPAQFWFDYLLVRTAGYEYRSRLMVGDASYNDPQVKKVYTLWKDLIERGFFNENANSFDSDEASKMLYDGKVAMTLNGTWTMSYFENTLGWQASIDYDIFSFPVIDPAITAVTVEVMDVIIQSKLGNVDETEQVMEYFTRVENLMKLNHRSGTFSPNKNTPSSFYSSTLNKVATIVATTPQQIYSYDLSTPPIVAEIGLSSFKSFIDKPSQYLQILEKTDKDIKQAFDINNTSF